MRDDSDPIKVFIADDSSVIRQRVATMLAERAIEIVGEAETPQDAIEGILAARPHVVILDFYLQGGTGLQVLRAVRHQEPSIRFVVFSNYTAPPYRKRFLGEGAHHVLDKSYEFHQLANAIEQVARSARTVGTADPENTDRR
jgi:DNA-binding NarL/FixJ family response regulator